MTNPIIQYIQQKLCLNYLVKTTPPKPEVGMTFNWYTDPLLPP